MARRRGSAVSWIFFLTVPMLFIIGAVLSVLWLQTEDGQDFFPAFRPLLFAAMIFCWVAFAAAVAAWRFLRKTQRRDKEKNSDRDRFLSEAAHELKTPLTVVRGTAEVIRDGLISSEQIPEYCDRILRETDAMTRLVNDLLDVTRMKSGNVSLSLRDVDLPALAASVTETLTPLAEQRGVLLQYEKGEELPVLLLDYDRIRQVLIIFIDNAVKHTPQGGQVTVSTGREGKTCFLSVRDTGSGIAPKDLPRIFDRFYKADPSRGGLSSGSGIGLSVAQQIVSLHGGSIDVESTLGVGTCFVARLPLREYKEEV